MNQQKIKLGKHTLTLQDISTKHKIMFQQELVDAHGKLNIVGAIDYILKYVVVQPQGLTLDDFSFAEASSLLNYTKDFLDLEGKEIEIVIVE